MLYWVFLCLSVYMFRQFYLYWLDEVGFEVVFILVEILFLLFWGLEYLVLFFFFKGYGLEWFFILGMLYVVISYLDLMYLYFLWFSWFKLFVCFCLINRQMLDEILFKYFRIELYLFLGIDILWYLFSYGYFYV